MVAKCEHTFTFPLFLIKQRKPVHTGYQVSLNPPLRIMASAMQEDMDASSHKSKKLRSFPLSFKLKVIEEAEMCGNRSAARKYDVDKRRVREWRAKKASISSLRLTKQGQQHKRVDGVGRTPQC